MTPDTVMIFAAGRGTRMGALIDNCPKPCCRLREFP
jgi:Nucleoside-diphosphate-sugar pyrophosphorylase involved in lipopolysaccharide biosynthesis/translation initiation factor 2B, gamma/epsilon subunits (eIF-2Bgamma/eIF-2Bepsilon)